MILVILCYKEEKEITKCLGGNRNRTSSSVNNVGSNGNYWSATVNNANNAYNLNFNTSGTVNPQNNNNRANGFGVRCVRIY